MCPSGNFAALAAHLLLMASKGALASANLPLSFFQNSPQVPLAVQNGDHFKGL
jgi:hypothetical protein